MTKQAVGVVTVLMVQWFLSVPGRAADETSRLPQGLRLERGAGTQLDKASAERIVSVLQGLRKNLVLERTRGLKDVELYQRAAPAVVFVTDAKESIGSGTLIDDKGHAITSWHVVGKHKRVLVFLKPRSGADLKDALAFAAVVEKLDQVADLALLRIVTPPRSLAFLHFGDASGLVVGQDVHAIGHPEGEVWTYTKGIISQIRPNYEWRTEEGITHRANIIQTQTPINPGNSGGPLFDDGGRLIAINSFRRAPSEGLNYAVSVDTIKDFLAREGNREATQREPPGKGSLRCTEGYDTMRRGWNDIIGCYQDAVAPPPDVWVVFRSLKEMAYVAMDSDTSGRSGKIDLVKKGLDSQWKIIDLYIDSDCDGTVDLIVRTASGQEVSSRLPLSNVRMTTLAKELDAAAKKRRIPYPTLRVCQ